MKPLRKQHTLVELLELNKFPQGRMIGYSKTMYMKRNTNNLVVFNARIYEKNSYHQIQDGKRPDEEPWAGDLNLTQDIKRLYDIIRWKKNIIITYETGEKILELEGNMNLRDENIYKYNFGL